MADTDTQDQPPPAPPPTPGGDTGLLDPALLKMMQQLMPAPVQVDQTPVHQSWLSRLGEALAGGAPAGMALSPADRQTAGLRALGDFGTSLMAASHYVPGQTVFSNLAQGFQGATRGELASQQLAANWLASQQDYQDKQTTQRLNILKEAVPLLNLQLQMQRLKAAGNIGLSTGPSTSGTPGTPGSILGTIARDPSFETAGQQANNPGNLMTTSAPGQTGVINLSGGRTLAAFPDVATGVAANADNLAAYQTQHGINTVAGAVARWVGDPKADLTSYTNDIAKALGVKPTDPIDLTDPKVQRAFILAQQPHETGGKTAWLNPADVDAGIALAQKRRQGAPGGPVVAAPAATPPAPGTPPAPATAAAGPPGVQMGGEPPAPPGAPPGAPAAAGGIGAALNPELAGRAQATVAPPPVIKAGAIPASKTGTDALARAGKTASAADSILAGMQMAQTEPTPPGTVLAAGPAAGTPPPPAAAAPVPQPGWGAQVGSYNATTTPAAPPAPQLATKADQPPPAVPPTPVTQPAPAVKPGDANTFVYDPKQNAIPQHIQEQAANTLLPREQAMLDDAQRSYLIARQAANLQADPGKAIQDAEQTFTQRKTDIDRQISERINKGQEQLGKWQADDYNQQKDIWKSNHDAMLARATKADELQRSFDIDTAKTTTGLMANDANTARGTLRILQQMAPYLDNLPNGVLGNLVQKFPDIVPMLQYSHIMDPSQATAAQVVLAARNYLSLIQKPIGSGSLRVPEMDALASYTPGTLNTPQARQEMMGRLLAVNQRVIDEYNYTLDHVGRADPKTGEKTYDIRGIDAAMNKPLTLDANGNPTADSGLGDVVPKPPPRNAPDSDHRAYQLYVQKHVAPGMPYYTYQPRTDPVTHQVIPGSDNQPIYDRVMRTKSFE